MPDATNCMLLVGHKKLGVGLCGACRTAWKCCSGSDSFCLLAQKTCCLCKSTALCHHTAYHCEVKEMLCILQAHNVQLGLAEMTVVACTATLAAVGAAAIPSAGLVTMLMVMQAVSLDQFASDLAVILAIDWLLDRCRTAVNVLGDAFGVVVINSLCKQDDSRIQHGEASSRPLAGSISGVTQLEMC